MFQCFRSEMQSKMRAFQMHLTYTKIADSNSILALSLEILEEAIWMLSSKIESKVENLLQQILSVPARTFIGISF